MPSDRKPVKKIIEKSRYLALIGVVGLLIASGAGFGWGLYKTAMLVYQMAIGVDRFAGVVLFIKVVDYFLIATTILILAVSLYELFIAEICMPEWMLARSLHDLKAKMSSMIILVMAVKFLEDVLTIDVTVRLMQTGLAISVVSAVLIAFSYFRKQDGA